jgi:type IV pilus assembly protein PilV
MRTLGSSSPRSRGFSLIEVMVALVVLSIGLLGIAKMEALSLSSTTVASMRSLASMEASSLAAAMHENRGYWSNGGDSSAATIAVQGATVSVSSGAPLLAATSLATGTCTTAGAACYCRTAGTPCSVTNMAAFDLQTWATTLNALLPNETASIVCNNLTPISCTITINWSENAVAINAQEAATANTAAAFQTPRYTLYVEP